MGFCICQISQHLQACCLNAKVIAQSLVPNVVIRGHLGSNRSLWPLETKQDYHAFRKGAF